MSPAVSACLDRFCAMRGASCTLDRKELKEVLMHTGGRLLARGRVHEIKSEHLGAGVYRVTLDEKEPES